MKRIVLIVLVFSLGIITMFSQVIHVPADSSTIQAAIEGASDGDTVLVAEGLYYENINFLGKAITVASKFIIDGETSHISKTIIDGSQYTDWRDASTVTMRSGEDTTSVLMGFTVTGGAGTLITLGGYTDYYGGGIFIVNSGGKIINNTIEDNQKTSNNMLMGNFGGGLSASVYNNHTAIVRDNIIRNNSIKAKHTYGAGAFLDGGRIIFENNSVTGNTLNATGYCNGAGLFWSNNDYPGTIKEVTIRNNFITDNTGTTSYNNNTFGGGGIATGFSFDNGKVEFYNNVICDNSIKGSGGGFLHWSGSLCFYNNTVCNNTATASGNNLAIKPGIVMYNNILWYEEESDISDISGIEAVYDTSWADSLRAYRNILKEQFKSDTPMFIPGSFELAENSPAIGIGFDSLEIEGKWYYAPATDIDHHIRPNPIDDRVDIGAYESSFPTSEEPLTVLGFETLLVYPNPTINLLTIETAHPDHYSIEIISLNGRVIYNTKMEGSFRQIDMSQFERGVYFIKVRSKELMRMAKVVKL